MFLWCCLCFNCNSCWLLLSQTIQIKAILLPYKIQWFFTIALGKAGFSICIKSEHSKYNVALCILCMLFHAPTFDISWSLDNIHAKYWNKTYFYPMVKYDYCVFKTHKKPIWILYFIQNPFKYKVRFQMLPSMNTIKSRFRVNVFLNMQ